MLFYFVLAVVILSTTWIHQLFNDIVPESYMDEVFHVPQAQAYCQGNFHIWDPKITTLPGLYVISASVLGPLQKILGDDYGCSVRNLRFLNLVFNWLNLVLLYKIISIRSKGESVINRIVATLSLGFSPLLFFFSFLYYTDPASTFTVLLMHYTFIKRKYIVSPLIGILAVLMRQTNIVWLIWYGCNILFEEGQDIFLKLLQPITAVPPKAPRKSSTKSKKKKEKTAVESYNYPPVSNLTYQELQQVFPPLVKRVVPKAYMYAIVFLMFLTFLVINGGVVVGDKEAHKPSINIPQLFYFAIFSITMGFPALTYGAGETIKLIQRNKLIFIFWIIVGLLVVLYNTVAHPYLLADNRHYTFYVWKRLYETRPILKYLLVPVYIGFGFFITNQIDLHPSLIFTFIIVVAVNLVPQKLLEFRYFLLPYLMLRLHMKASHVSVVAIELVWAIILNWFTIQKFLYDPFKWPHSPDVQRFMW